MTVVDKNSLNIISCWIKECCELKVMYDSVFNSHNDSIIWKLNGSESSSLG
jgi:hypothetical protein